MGGGRGGNFGNTYGKTLDAISNVLTAASLIPGIDTFADIAAIPVDLLRGDFLSAGLDVLGAIPFVGEIADAAKTAKTADNIIDTAKAVDKATDAAKTADKAKDISKAVKRISPLELKQTHKPTMSQKQFSNLVESIKKDGIKESIKYVEYNGQKYVVDGHHRLQAAKQLNLKDIPVEKVSLPYKGYKTIEDLLWPD